MSSSSAVVKKKHVRFASVDNDDNERADEQEEDTLFDKRRDTGKRPKSAGKRTMKPGCDKQVLDGGRCGHGSCGRWMITVTLCMSFLGLGMSISVLGPTFEDLAVNVRKDISNISYVFLGRSVGYIGGSLFGGFLFDYINPHLLLGFSLLLTASGMLAIPFCKQALLLTVFMSSIGMSMGVLDTGGNVFILNVWGEQAGPSMQAMHFSWAAGAFVSPIIAKLLFGLDGNSSMETMATNSTLPAITCPNDHKFLCYVNSTLGSMWAYIVIGTFLGLVAFLFFLLFTCTSVSYDRARMTPGKRPVAKHHKAVVVLLACFYFFYVGAEVMYGSFIYNYAKDYAHMPQAEAAGLNSLFWAMFAVFRGLAIFFVACLYPGTLILLSLVGCTVSSLLHCLFSREKVVMWSCSALYGASMATTFPSGISWLEQYTMVTGNVASVLVVGAALGEMVLPTVLGFLLGKFSDHPLLMYLSLIMATITSILFPVIYKLASNPSGQSRKTCIRGRPDADDSEFCQALLDSGGKDEEEEEEEEEDELDTEADQWNDADFEVIEMDDTASLLNSPDKTASPLDVTASSVASSQPLTVSFSGADSPRRKLLLSANREKRD